MKSLSPAKKISSILRRTKIRLSRLRSKRRQILDNFHRVAAAQAESKRHSSVADAAKVISGVVNRAASRVAELAKGRLAIIARFVTGAEAAKMDAARKLIDRL